MSEGKRKCWVLRLVKYEPVETYCTWIRGGMAEVEESDGSVSYTDEQNVVFAEEDIPKQRIAAIEKAIAYYENEIDDCGQRILDIKEEQDDNAKQLSILRATLRSIKNG